MAENQYGFPTEVLSLPSQGLLYPEDSPLRSGTIDVKYMTAKEEDILTSTNLIEQGVVITKLIESIIANPKVKLDDMLVGDKNAVMVGTRILGYGKDYGITLIDPDTNERVEHIVDLTKLENKPIDEKLFENGNNFTFELPNSKRVLGWKFITQRDENEISEELKALRKVTRKSGIEQEVTTRLRKVITSVDGDESVGTINNFVNNEFLSRDSKAFRDYLMSITPDVDLNIIIDFSSGEEVEVTVPMTVEFFWPKS